MTVAENLNRICQEARPLIEEKLALDAELTKLRDRASDEGLSWSIIRRILIAEAQDAEDDGDRLSKLGVSGALLTDYLAMLRHTTSDTNCGEEKFLSPQSDSRPTPTLNRPAVGNTSAAPIAGLVAAEAFSDDGSIPAILRR